MRSRDVGSATFGPAGLPRHPVDAEDSEPRGRRGAILGEAGTWPHFEWGQSFPAFLRGKQGVKHPPPTDTDTHTYSLFPLLPQLFLMRGGELCDQAPQT